MSQVVIGIIWLICSIIAFVAYHKIFTVVYFDSFNGCLWEIIRSAVIGAVLMLFIVFVVFKYWWVGLIVLALIIIIGVIKNR